MRLIGITGSIGCGKTTVSSELIRQGFPVIDGDSLSRELTAPHGLAIGSIRAAFGDSYISRDGSLHREHMAQLVFSDPKQREKLDQVMAPFIHAAAVKRIEKARVSGAELCFLDMPLLFEKGYDRMCDTVWCVWLPEDLQLRRLMERNGYTRDEALSRMRAMMSSDEKANLAPVVIDNSGSVSDTLMQVSSLLEKELARARIPSRRKRASGQDAAVPAGSSFPAVSVPDLSGGVERSEASRRRPSSRRIAWRLPRWMSVALISMGIVLALAFTSQMLMNAYLAKQHQVHEAEQRSIDEHYPLMYSDMIRKSASEFNLSPALVAAVIMNESSFRPSAESSVGAHGLMQLMPDTAEWIARKLRVDDYSAQSLDDPQTNIRLGCWYLNYLSSLFSGDPLCVVCAYHAGQGEVAGWLSNPLYSNDGKTLIHSSLPEGPTKNYAGRVIRDYGIYKAKYFSQTDPLDSSSSDSDPV